jgi:hypothetical protein
MAPKNQPMDTCITRGRLVVASHLEVKWAVVGLTNLAMRNLRESKPHL